MSEEELVLVDTGGEFVVVRAAIGRSDNGGIYRRREDGSYSIFIGESLLPDSVNPHLLARYLNQGFAEFEREQQRSSTWRQTLSEPDQP